MGSAGTLPTPLGRLTLRTFSIPGRQEESRPSTRVRVGTDLVEIAKVRRVFEARPDLLASIFTEEELNYSRARRPMYPHLAARFAAKEATLKALGTGLTASLAWKDIEVTKELSGAPRLALHGAAAEIAGSQGLAGSSLSLSHSAHVAIAVVLLLNDGVAR
ncbi:MAG: holo-ACP synthase [Candidatus Methylomirabilia bacterium]